MRFAASVLVLMIAASGVQAADLVIEEPVVVDTAASSLRGTVEVGALAQYVDQEEGPFTGWAGGGYVSAALWGGEDSFVWGLDGYLDGNGFDPDNAAKFVGVLGGHAGLSFGTGTIGAFGSIGLTSDQDGETRGGASAGIEGIVELDNLAFFGQLGWAHVNVEADGADPEGFMGPFVHGGVVFSLSDDFAILADAGYGRTDHFTDNEAEGTFATAGIKAAFALPTDFDAFITAGYEWGFYDSIAEDQSATTHTFKVGLAIPFGDGNTAASALNPLATYTAPYRAASWGDVID
jgi:hypothetical protein